MDIVVALNGSKERNLSFAPGDEVTLNLIVYAQDGDTTPITPTNFYWSTGGGSFLPVGSQFSFPCVNRTPYSIAADIAGVRTTLVYGIIEAPFGYRCSWYCGGGIFPPVIQTAQAVNVILSDVGEYYVARNVEDALDELGETVRSAQPGYLTPTQVTDVRNGSLIVQNGEQTAVAYTAGLPMTSTLQRVSYLNDVYAPLGNALPFLTSGTFESGKFLLIAGATRKFLSSVEGAGGVGYEFDGSSAETNLGEKNRRFVDALDFPGATLAHKIQFGLDNLSGSRLSPFTIRVPQNKDGNAYEWGTMVDVSNSADSWISVEGDGIIAVKATAAITAFFALGIGNKNDESRVSGFSFDCGNFNVDCAILNGSVRGCSYERIELKRTGTGSFIDGIRFAGDSVHTGSEPGASNEACTVTHLHDSGDSAVSRSMVYFTGGPSAGVIVKNVRACRDRWVDVIGSSFSSGFRNCEFSNIYAILLAARVTRGNSIVNLQDFVANTAVENLYVFNFQDSVNYGLLVGGLSATVSSALHANNLGTGYNGKDILVSPLVLRTHVNGVSYNAGDPNISGNISVNQGFRESGGLIYDTDNNALFVGDGTATKDGYQAVVFRRRIPIANDGVQKITLSVNDVRLPGVIFSVVPEMSSTDAFEGLFSARLSGGAACRLLTSADSTKAAATTGALTGTTGAAGKVTVSANDTDRSLYIENRTGAARFFIVSVL